MTLGLVLAGGAARGAYEAGVMRFMFGDLTKRLGRVVWPKVVSGTSVGALNGVFVAAQTEEGLAVLNRRWTQMHINDVYRLRTSDVMNAVRSVFGSQAVFSLLDASPLRDMVQRDFPHQALRSSIQEGRCKAFIVSATELTTGFNSLFVDSAANLELKVLPGAREYRTPIGPDHLLASAALPFLFPPVSVGSGFHVDGGLRQNTPLRPVLKAGADQIIVIGVKRIVETQRGQPVEEVTPNLTFLAGKSLNALLLDPVERDLRQMRETNRILAWGAEAFGPEFTQRIQNQLGLRQTSPLFIHPSEDLGVLASTIFKTRPPKVSRPLRTLLSFSADVANSGESDLLSYIFFDKAYTAELEQLGFEDARRQEEGLAKHMLAQLT